MSLRLLPLLAGLALLASLAPAQQGATPSARQRKSLAPLIDVIAQRIDPHLPSLDRKRIEREVKRALSDQISALATRNLDLVIIKLIALDIGVNSDAGWALVKRNLFEGFATDYTPEELALLGADFKLEEHALDLKPRFAREATPPVYRRGFEYLHSRVVRHDRAVLAELEDELEDKLERDAARGMKKLAATYSPLFQDAFGIEKHSRDYAEVLEADLSTRSTDRAMLSALVSLRVLARPSVRKVLGAEKAGERVEVEAAVRERVVKELEETRLLERLRADHVAMLADPKAHMARLRELEKD